MCQYPWKMFTTSKDMFIALDADPQGVIERVAQDYELHPRFIRYYIDHLCQAHRDNPQAHAYFDSEFGLFKRTIATLQHLSDSLGIVVETASVLDVGCNSGHSLRAFEKLGAGKVVGIEYDPQRYATSQYMLECHSSSAKVCHASILDDNVIDQCGGGNFDLITCFDVIEHLPTPDKAIANFSQLLRPGGRVILTIANRYYPDIMLCEPHYGLPGMTLLERDDAKIYHDLVRDSEYDVFNWFTRNALEKLFRRHGFEVIPEAQIKARHIRSEVFNALKALWFADYPSASIRNKVRRSVCRVGILNACVRNATDFLAAQYSPSQRN
ncbi:MAG: class I SAM-dependent methyltransferase [Candidatus Lindowbacteria bacterium]|nr:class I SAM-dependent methyltransferase [Candidatus Lindowbacteria bacterium]